MSNKYQLVEAGCTVCNAAVKEITKILDENKLEVITLTPGDARVESYEAKGLKSVPALVSPEGEVMHINFGADISALKLSTSNA
ncbi:MAG: thioredoxin family protein [Candidatus Caenarcaniphilales bacterium]|nr:thioredoxin family protein [Candidatus Caenarcaniphilales bacterium]